MKKIDVQKLRRRLDMTQAQLAERLGVKQASVSRWENGGTMIEPVRKLLEQMAEEDS